MVVMVVAVEQKVVVGTVAVEVGIVVVAAAVVAVEVDWLTGLVMDLVGVCL